MYRLVTKICNKDKYHTRLEQNKRFMAFYNNFSQLAWGENTGRKDELEYFEHLPPTVQETASCQCAVRLWKKMSFFSWAMIYGPCIFSCRSRTPSFFVIMGSSES